MVDELGYVSLSRESAQALFHFFSGRHERRLVIVTANLEFGKALAVDITANLQQHADMGAEGAFRYAAGSWMQSNNIIRVHRNGQVLPTSCRLLCQ